MRGLRARVSARGESDTVTPRDLWEQNPDWLLSMVVSWIATGAYDAAKEDGRRLVASLESGHRFSELKPVVVPERMAGDAEFVAIVARVNEFVERQTGRAEAERWKRRCCAILRSVLMAEGVDFRPWTGIDANEEPEIDAALRAFDAALREAG